MKKIKEIIENFMIDKTGSYSLIFLIIPIIVLLFAQISYYYLNYSKHIDNVVYLNVLVLFSTVLHFCLSFVKTLHQKQDVKKYGFFALFVLLGLFFFKSWTNLVLFLAIFIDLVHTAFQYKLISEFNKNTDKISYSSIIDYGFTLVVHVLPIILLIDNNLINKALILGVQQSSAITVEGNLTSLIIENFPSLKIILCFMLGIIAGSYLAMQIRYKLLFSFKNLYLLIHFLINLIIWKQANLDIILFVINITHAFEYIVYYFYKENKVKIFKGLNDQINFIILCLTTVAISLILSLNNQLGIQIGLFFAFNHYFVEIFNWRKNE